MRPFGVKKRYWLVGFVFLYSIISYIDQGIIVPYLQKQIIAERAGYGSEISKKDIDWSVQLPHIGPCFMKKKWLVYTYKACFKFGTLPGAAVFTVKGPPPILSPFGLMISKKPKGLYFDGVKAGDRLVRISDFGKNEEFYE